MQDTELDRAGRACRKHRHEHQRQNPNCYKSGGTARRTKICGSGFVNPMRKNMEEKTAALYDMGGRFFPCF